MIVTYARSSSIGSYEWCPFKYFLVYGMGLKDEANFKAIKGTCTHKALELLARRKLASQEGKDFVTEEELGVSLHCSEITPLRAMDLAFSFYKKAYPEFPWASVDKQNCQEWMFTALEWESGLFNPLNREVLAPELFFDLEIDKPWAEYSWRMPDGTLTAGHYRIRGTMDLLVKHPEDDSLEYIDWKTGKMVNWNKGGTKKTYEDFQKDPQLLLYYYALRKLFPNKSCMMTVFYLQEGGPQSVFFDDSDVIRAELLLKDFFEKVKKDNNPRRIIKESEDFNQRVNWKCHRLCGFYKNKAKNGQRECDYYHGQLQELGMERVMQKFAETKNLNKYEGGGRSAK